MVAFPLTFHVTVGRASTALCLVTLGTLLLSTLIFGSGKEGQQEMPAH